MLDSLAHLLSCKIGVQAVLIFMSFLLSTKENVLRHVLAEGVPWSLTTHLSDGSCHVGKLGLACRCLPPPQWPVSSNGS